MGFRSIKPIRSQLSATQYEAFCSSEFPTSIYPSSDGFVGNNSLWHHSDIAGCALHTLEI